MPVLTDPPRTHTAIIARLGRSMEGLKQTGLLVDSLPIAFWHGSISKVVLGIYQHHVHTPPLKNDDNDS